MSLDVSKVDCKLGKKIQKKLVSLGIATPMDFKNPSYVGDSQEKIDLISSKYNEIMRIIGLDLSDDSLRDTPNRLAKMYVNELFWGLSPDNFPKCTTVDNKMSYDEMVLVKGISVSSSCEHHFQSISGYATIAYVPEKKILGLSKFNRVVEYFSRRPQVQERLTCQIFHSLSLILKTSDVAVLIDAEHGCVRCRGTEDLNSSTVTSKIGGVFRKKATRAEFISLAGKLR
jgi:GTP cyclohydrolase IA